MSDLWLPMAVVVAAFALSYLFCMRPMRRGQCVTTRNQPAHEPGDLDRAVSDARAELAQLRAGSGSNPQPGAERAPQSGGELFADRSPARP